MAAGFNAWNHWPLCFISSTTPIILVPCMKQQTGAVSVRNQTVAIACNTKQENMGIKGSPC